MASVDNEQLLYGLDKELAEKAAAKYDPVREREAREFIEIVSGSAFPSDNFHESLKDGVLLCQMMNNILPNNQIKIAVSKMPFKQMENIGFFLDRVELLGVPPHERFMTIDLYEAKNMNQVINTIFSVSRHAAAKGFQGPLLGPKLTEKNERVFTEEQLMEARAMPTKLMSYSTNVSSGLRSTGRREIGGKYLDKEAGEDVATAAEVVVARSAPSVQQTPVVQQKPVVVAQAPPTLVSPPVVSPPVIVAEVPKVEPVTAAVASVSIRDASPTAARRAASRPRTSNNNSATSPSASPSRAAAPIQPPTQPQQQQQPQYQPPIAKESPSPIPKASTLSITQFKTYAEYKAARAALEAANKAGTEYVPEPAVTTAAPASSYTARRGVSRSRGGVPESAGTPPVAPVASGPVLPQRTVSRERSSSSGQRGASRSVERTGRGVHIVREYQRQPAAESEDEVVVFDD